MKKILASVIVLASLGLGGTALAATATHFAVVDYQQVFEQVPQGKATLEQLKDQLAPQISKLKSQQQDLASQIQDFERNSPTMSASDRKSEQDKLTSEQQAFQQDVVQLRQTEQQKEDAAANTFQNDLISAIHQVAYNGHYDMVFNSQAVPYYSSQYDVTDAVVSRMKRLA